VFPDATTTGVPAGTVLTPDLVAELKQEMLAS